jgi:Uma2 family endonuclease
LEVDPKLIADRARLGLDIRDEMWDGELHVVPPANGPHQRLGAQLLRTLAPLADARGLEMTYETGFFRHEKDYRVPDLAAYRRAQSSNRGMEGAELVIEIRSPGDESMAKIPWYLAQGCREVLIVDRDTLDVELYGPAGRIEPARSEVLGCTFTTVHGPTIEVAWDGGDAIVSHR